MNLSYRDRCCDGRYVKGVCAARSRLYRVWVNDSMGAPDLPISKSRLRYSCLMPQAREESEISNGIGPGVKAPARSSQSTVYGLAIMSPPVALPHSSAGAPAAAGSTRAAGSDPPVGPADREAENDEAGDYMGLQVNHRECEGVGQSVMANLGILYMSTVAIKSEPC